MQRWKTPLTIAAVVAVIGAIVYFRQQDLKKPEPDHTKQEQHTGTVVPGGALARNRTSGDCPPRGAFRARLNAPYLLLARSLMRTLRP